VAAIKKAPKTEKLIIHFSALDAFANLNTLIRIILKRRQGCFKIIPADKP
jgi:hypothetical protein